MRHLQKEDLAYLSVGVIVFSAVFFTHSRWILTHFSHARYGETSPLPMPPSPIGAVTS
jgi:hypothetical protein